MKKFRFRLNFWVLIFVVFIIGTAINTLVYRNILHWQKKIAQSDFNNIAGDRIAALQATVNTDLTALWALQSFFASSGEVSSEEFSLFTGQLLRLYPHVNSYHWIPRVKASDRKSFEEDARRELKMPFQISEISGTGGHFVAAKKAEEYYPTLYVEPQRKNQLSVGFNQFSVSERRRCMIKTMDSKTMIATRLHPLWRFLPQEENAYFFVFVPVYEKGKPSETLEHRKENLKGYVAAGFHIDPLIRAAYSNSNMSEVDLEFYAETVDTKNALIHQFQRYGYTLPQTSPKENLYTHRESLSVADQRWLVIAKETEFFKPGMTTMEANGFFMAGLLLTLLLCVSLILIELRKREHFFHSMSLRDELTNLYNRRGFLVLANEHLKLIRRKKMESMVLFADLDGLKKINDNYGHEEGDKALNAAATILRSSFRESDIIARTGGDEFAIFAFDVKGLDREAIFRHLAENIEQYNRTHSLPYKVRLSIGSTPIDLEHESSLERILSNADKMMYSEKKAHHKQDDKESAHFKIEPPNRN